MVGGGARGRVGGGQQGVGAGDVARRERRVRAADRQRLRVAVRGEGAARGAGFGGEGVGGDGAGVLGGAGGVGVVDLEGGGVSGGRWGGAREGALFGWLCGGVERMFGDAEEGGGGGDCLTFLPEGWVELLAHDLVLA